MRFLSIRIKRTSAVHALACMLVNSSICEETDRKGMSDYLSATPADGTLAAHCRPNGNSAFSVNKATSDKIHHSSWPVKKKMRW